MTRTMLAASLAVSLIALATAVFASYSAGVVSSKSESKRQLANLLLGPIEPLLEKDRFAEAFGKEYPDDAASLVRSLTMTLGTIAVEKPDVSVLNAGALASLCLAVKHRQRLLRPNESASEFVHRYLRDVEVEVRLVGMQRRQTAPATKCALLDASPLGG